MLVENKDIISPIITEMYKESNRKANFPYKMEERTKKENYIHVSILPPVSKIFERNMFDQANVPVY